LFFGKTPVSIALIARVSLLQIHFYAKQGHGVVIEFAAGLSAVVAVTMGGLLLWTTAKLRETRLGCAGCERARAEALAVLDTVPLAAFRWPLGRDPDGYSVQTVAYPKFLAVLAPGDAEHLEAARGALHRSGTPFSLTVGLRSGGAFAIEGRRAATGEIVLWPRQGPCRDRRLSPFARHHRVAVR